MSATDAEYATGSPVQPSRRRANRTTRRAVRRSRRAREHQTPVPMLDWPTGLFSDEATSGELEGDDCPLPPHIVTDRIGGESTAFTRH